MGLFDKFKSGLSKTRSNIFDQISSVVKRSPKITDEMLEEIEELLIMGDVGVETTRIIIEGFKKRMKTGPVEDGEAHLKILEEEIQEHLLEAVPEDFSNKPLVILVVGVNGTGKTTSIGKLAYHFKNRGKSVILGAADTFRAAAIDQLEVWAERAQAELVKHQPGSDPAAVAFDTVSAALSRNKDVVLIDTAGRLHTKTNLMEELAKISRVIQKKIPNAPHETLLVLDGTTGQNAISQAKKFIEKSNVTGIVLTKLDGTAKGGAVLSIAKQLNLPVQYIGLGEGIDDLQPFNKQLFVKGLFE